MRSGMIKRIGIASMISMVLILLTPFSVLARGFEAETVYNSVVVVYSGNSIGSGFAVGVDCIITNAHVVADTSNVRVKTYSGDTCSAAIVSIDTGLDIAVLVVSGVVFTPLKPASVDDSKVGDEVYTIGAPNSMAYTLTKGILSAKDRKVGSQYYLQTDAAINSGNSGGPLLNNEGEVLGMNTLKMSDSEGIGLAIPITTAYAYLEGENVSIDENGEVNEEFDMPETTAEPSGSDTLAESKTEPSSEITLLIVLLCCSAALNVALVTILTYSKNKSIQQKPDASERTDFDIDIGGVMCYGEN
jgi:serine protease Do